MRSRKFSPSRWQLYWVASDGLEDCFVVARNCKSAEKIECETNGFESGEVTVHRVKHIPEDLIRRFRRRLKKGSATLDLPGYADDLLLNQLSALFRDINDEDEILIDEMVYKKGVPPRPIGGRFFREFQRDIDDLAYGEVDHYRPSQIHCLTVLGICVARCQEIEHLIANSFIFAVSEKQKRKYETIDDLICGWKKKTLGQLIEIIKDSHEIEPMVEASLDLFIEMRNKLVHGLTMDPKYEFEDSWGEAELMSFLVLFEGLSRPIRQAFRGSFYASLELGKLILSKDGIAMDLRLTKKQKRDIPIYAHLFSPKPQNGS